MFQYKKILSIFIFFSFFDIFVVDFKIFVELSNAFFTFMSSNSLSSFGPNLVFFEILIFRGYILKNVYKEIPSFLASLFPLYILSSQIRNLTNFWTKILFSLWKIQLEGPTLARSIDDFAAHYFHYLYLKYTYKKCCVKYTRFRINWFIER